MLPLRRVGSASTWFRAPLVRPAGVSPPAGARPRIYIAPLDTRADQKILRASLAAAGEPEPVWVPRRSRGVAEEELRSSFLQGDPVLVPLEPPAGGPDRLARLLVWAQDAGTEVDLIPLEVLWGPVGRTPSSWNLLLGNPYDPPGGVRWTRVRVRPSHVRVVLGAPGTLSALKAEAPQPD